MSIRHQVALGLVLALGLSVPVLAQQTAPNPPSSPKVTKRTKGQPQQKSAPGQTQTTQPAPAAVETNQQKYERGEKFIDDNYNLYLPALTAPPATPAAAPAPKPGTVQLHNPFAAKKNPLNDRVTAAATDLDAIAAALTALSEKAVFVTGGDPEQNGKNVELGRQVAIHVQDALDAYTKSMQAAGQLLSPGSPDANLATIPQRDQYFKDEFKVDPNSGVKMLGAASAHVNAWANGLRVATGTDKPVDTSAKGRVTSILGPKKIIYNFHQNEVDLTEQLVAALKQNLSASEDILAGKPVPAPTPSGPVNPYGPTPATAAPVNPYATPATPAPKPQSQLLILPRPGEKGDAVVVVLG